MLLYFVNYLDRVNVGFAALTMNRDLGFSPSVYGLAASIFFVSYALFQIPATMFLERIGARRAVCAHHGGLGTVSAATALVTRRSAFMPRAFFWAWRRRDFSRA